MNGYTLEGCETTGAYRTDDAVDDLTRLTGIDHATALRLLEGFGERLDREVVARIAAEVEDLP